MIMKKNRQALNEVVDINGSKIFIENGKVKTVLNEIILQSGYTSVEEAKQLTIYELFIRMWLKNTRIHFPMN